MQEACTCLERCSKPVIAAIQGACVGAGVDIVTAADMRICAPSARFCVKEVDLAITADLGSLQRLPQIIGEGRARDMALTARAVDAQQALQYGLVTHVACSDAALGDESLKLAAQLAHKPQLALSGTKEVMLQARRQQVQEGLRHVGLWNAAMLWSNELQDTVKAVLQQRAKL